MVGEVTSYPNSPRILVDGRRIELPTPILQGSVASMVHARPNFWWNRPGTIRHLPRARRVLSQLSYGPVRSNWQPKVVFINSEVPSTSSSRMLLRAMGGQRDGISPTPV